MNLEQYWEPYREYLLVSGYSPKQHYHLDPYFDFSKNHQLVYEKIFMGENNRLHGHSFLPFLKTIAKSPKHEYSDQYEKYFTRVKKRPIFLTGHLDKYILGFYAYVSNIKYQDLIQTMPIKEVPTAYRTDLDGKCNIQFAKEVFDEVKRMGDCAVVATDVSSFFDNIDHNRLKENWCEVLGIDRLPGDFFKLYKQLTTYPYIRSNSILKHFGIDLSKEKPKAGNLLSVINQQGINSTSALFHYLSEKDLIVKNRPVSEGAITGIPQGLSLSCVLSNIYLIDFDAKIQKEVFKMGGLYRRYCDDIIIVIPIDEIQNVTNLLHQEIVGERGMTMKEKKTEIGVFKTGLDGQSCELYERPPLPLKTPLKEKSDKGYIQYLGFTFDGKKTLIRNSSVSRYYRKMSQRARKTVRMAYSKNGKSNLEKGKRGFRSDKIFRKQIYERYTHFGKRNFLSYVYKASSDGYTNSKGQFKPGHDSLAMRRQVRNHMEILDRFMEDKSAHRFEILHQREEQKKAKGRKIRKKRWKKK